MIDSAAVDEAYGKAWLQCCKLQQQPIAFLLCFMFECVCRAVCVCVGLSVCPMCPPQVDWGITV